MSYWDTLADKANENQEKSERYSFIAQTASDYNMSFELVESYYNKYSDATEFYKALESYIEHRANSINH